MKNKLFFIKLLFYYIIKIFIIMKINNSILNPSTTPDNRSLVDRNTTMRMSADD